MLVVHTLVTELMSVEFTEMSFATLNYGRPVFSLVLLMLTVANLGAGRLANSTNISIDGME